MRRLLLLASLGLAACAPPAADTALVVLARLGEPGLRSEPAVAPQPVRLGNELRPALCLAPGSSARVALPAGARALALGVGAWQRPAEAEPLSVRLELDGEAGPHTLFEASLPAGAGGWLDARLALPRGDAPASVEFASAGASGPGQVCWGSVTVLGAAPAAEEAPPNLVLLSLDTLAASHLGAFGFDPEVSPALDAFLAEGFSFRRAFVQYPSTYTSHSSLFTGQYPVHHGRYTGVPAPLESLVGELARHGYVTAGFTEDAYVGSAFGFARGFDRYDDGESERFAAVSGNAELTFARAADWLERWGGDTRFFLFVHTYEVHSPYVPRDADAQALADRLTPQDRRRFPAVEVAQAIRHHNDGSKLLDPRDVRRLSALYAAEVHTLDGVFQGFLERLERAGLAGRTVVIVTSDHGEQFGEEGKLGHGQTLHNRVLQVPLGFRWPGRIRPGSSDAPVELVDVLPTALELAGIEVPPDVDGTSLAGLLSGEDHPDPRSVAFSELHGTRGDCLHWPGPGPCRLGRYAVQTARYKYESSQVPRYERLYDLSRDPLETHDLAGERPELLAEYRALLAGYLERGAARRRPGPEPVEEPMDEETRARLRALGYLD